jgi:hypothetical protein
MWLSMLKEETGNDNESESYLEDHKMKYKSLLKNLQN